MTSDLPLSLFLLLLSLPSLLALPSDLDVLLRLEFLASSEPSSWNPNHHCSWRGVSCDSRSRVTSIRLPSSVRFRGKLSPSIGRLDALRVLALPFLGLRGVLPPEVAEMESLEVLDLRGNSLQGPLPARFGRRLRILKLGFNRFHGVIPLGLRECSELELLDLSHNRLGGGIPPWLGGMCKLRELHLSFNRFGGRIPPEIGEHCGSLEHLELAGNGLIGRIPGEIGQLRKLQSLDVSRNQLDGPVPPELGDCVHLAVIVLSDMDGVVRSRWSGELNHFEGGIDGRITGLPKLRVLWAPGASLSGMIPANWESCGSLEVVNLGGNQLSGELPLAFVNCRQLKHLNLSRNKLTGELDPMLPVPCLDVFDVSGNQLSGAIPNFTFNGCRPLNVPADDSSSAYDSFFSRKLQVEESLRRLGMGSEVAILHDFGRNNFSGSIPYLPVAKERLHRQTVYALLLNGNKLSGPFPQHLLRGGKYMGGLVLDISDNLLSGSISAGIGSVCGSLMVLDASGNQLTGTLPFHLGLCNALRHLDFSRNQLQGRIPESLSLLKHLKHFSLAGNNITGSIPTSLHCLLSSDVLDHSSNTPFGGAPSEIIALGNLSVLNHNTLLTKIPMFGAKKTSISMFSEPNNTSEPAPSSAFKGSSGTILGRVMLKPSLVLSALIPSGNIRGRSLESTEEVPPSGKGSGFSSIEIASISSAAAIVSVLLALVVIYIYTRKCAPKAKVQSAGKKEVTVFVNIGAPLTYEIVVRATGNFSASNCIGSGGFGATYKAEIAPGVIVAIKRLFVGKIQGVQQFHAEIKTLGRWRHPNLVTLIGFHVSEVEMFLIYNYLPGGNLEKFISTRNRRPVDWRVLHKIALNVACALAYLHDQCVPRILHRDVKPSNILLDNDFNAYLSDFGLARLLGNSETHATTGVAGTFGYVAPEYAMTCRVSDKADVYSYGVVLLELLSDKKALDPSFSPYGNGFNIVNWATMLLKKGRAREFFIEGLWGAGPSDDLIDTLHLALKCTVDSLTNRPTIKQVVQHLKKIQP